MRKYWVFEKQHLHFAGLDDMILVSEGLYN